MWIIPIFIITCNRLMVLQDTIASYQAAIRSPYEIVIHDNHSTYPPMVAYLQELERQGVRVYWHADNITHPDELNKVRLTVDDYFRDHEAPYYVVADPDVALDPGDGDLLELYMQILNERRDINVVGPMLHADDLPDHYPFKARIVETRRALTLDHPNPRYPWRGKSVPYDYGPVDTTFGMYRRDFPYRRLVSGIRVCRPYDARHLDWYIDPEHMSEDQLYYMRHATQVSHWGGTFLRERRGEAYTRE